MSAEFYTDEDFHTKEQAVFFKVTLPNRDGAASTDINDKAVADHVKHYPEAFAAFKELHPEVAVDEKGKVFLDPEYKAPVVEEEKIEKSGFFSKSKKEIARENEEASKVD